MQAGASAEVRGARAVAEQFSGRAGFARPALVNGAAGAVWAPGGRSRAVFGFTITRGKIVGIDLVADPARLRQLDLIDPHSSGTKHHKTGPGRAMTSTFFEFSECVPR